MNEIAQKATAEKFLLAIEKEHLSKKVAGECIKLVPAQVSYLFNEKYWSRLGNTYWDRVLAWVNSGQSLKEYSEKHGKVLIQKEVISKPLVKVKPEALEIRKKELTERKQEPQRLTTGQMVDLLLAEKAFLQTKIDAIDVLLNHYIS